MAIKGEVNGRWASAVWVGALLAPLAWFGAQASSSREDHKHPGVIRHQLEGKSILGVKKIPR